MSESLAVKIRLGAIGRGGSIELAGVDVSNYVQGLSLTADPGDLTRLTLHFVKIDVDIEGPVDVTALGDWYRTYRVAQAIRDGLDEAAIAAEGDAK